MKLSSDLAWRGLIKDKTFNANNWLDKPQTFYLGIDASADSLTVGNLAIVLLALRLSRNGWQTILVMGGGTSLVGDPGGKTRERSLIDLKQVEHNIAGVKSQVESLFKDQKHAVVNNADWLKNLKFLDFLREVGKHFSMTELMQRDFVAQRMGHRSAGISYAEFGYSLIQGYDYWHLFNKYQVVLQIGGSDQWANMLSGVSLIRKKENKTAHALSMPLVVNKTTGRKFGKSEEEAVWLDSDKTSPTQFYQFWVNTTDEDVENYLKIFTFIPKRAIEKLINEHKRSPGERIAQAALAEHLTVLVHGEKHGVSAGSVTSFLKGTRALDEATEDDINQIRREIPTIKVKVGMSIVSCLVTAGLASSNSEARRLLASGAVYINGRQADHDLLTSSDFEFGRNRLLLRRGKAYKDSALLEVE